MNIQQPLPATIEISHPFGANAGPAKPRRRLADATLNPRFQGLAMVLERLWLFYDAMRHGKPLANSDQLLKEMGTAILHPGATSNQSCLETEFVANTREPTS